MKNIVFIVNHYKTYFFLELANYLKKNGYVQDVYWISSSDEFSKYLITQGVNDKDIVDCVVKDYKAYHDYNIDYNWLGEMERFLPMSLLNVIKMDRNLSKKSIKFSLWYAEFVLKKVNTFFSNKQIDAFFSEQTWAFEVLSYAVANYQSIPAYSMHTIRYPTDRFAFFHKSQANSVVSVLDNREQELFNAKAWLEQFRLNNEKPFYFYANNKVPTIQLSWLFKLRKNLFAPKNEASIQFKQLIKTKLYLAYNTKRLLSYQNKWIKDYTEIANDRFVLIMLHKQPEASIDLLDIYNNDQLNLIKQLSYALPIGMQLYVKEHSNALGDRSVQWYKKLENLSNIKFISPFLDSRELIKQSNLVVSVSGTACLEAALLGKAAICTADMFFNPILKLSNCSTKDIGLMLKNDESVFSGPLDKDIIQYLETIYENSFKGLISDPISTPECITKQNIICVSEAIDIILNQSK